MLRWRLGNGVDVLGKARRAVVHFSRKRTLYESITKKTDPLPSPGFRRGVGGDGYDGDGQGSRLWAVPHGPLGEASFSASQAKKILGPKSRFIEF